MFAAALTYQTAWRWFVLQAKPAKNIPLAKAKPSKSGSVTLELQRHAQAHKKAEPIQVKISISSNEFIISVQRSPMLNQAIQYDV